LSWDSQTSRGDVQVGVTTPPPLVKLGAAEIERIRVALIEAGSLKERASIAA
jgi:hypothetical protein